MQSDGEQSPVMHSPVTSPGRKDGKKDDQEYEKIYY
jgi:hypothetical protein